MKMLIKKYGIRIDEDLEIPKDKTHIRKCEADDRIFFGYKGRQFFDGQNVYKGIAIERATSVIKHITELVAMKNELNLLASLIHELIEPKSILLLCDGLKFIPIDWDGDLAVYTN